MKTPQPLKILVASVSLLLPFLADAGSAFLRTNDASGGCALTNNAGTNWTISGAISAANDYYTSNWFARTPPGGNMTFAGNSLTLQPPSGQGTPMRSLLFKGVNGSVITINNVTNAGGIINLASGSAAVPTFTGNLMTVVSNSTIQADQANCFIGWALAGSADLTNTSGQARTVTYTNSNTAFTGRFVINNNITVAFNSRNGAPGNPAVPTPSQIDLGAGCTLLDNAGIAYTNPNGGITLEGNSTINASSTNPTVIAVPIVENVGPFNLTKRGGGALTLSGSNSFSGGLTMQVVTAGSQLNINSSNALGTGVFTLAISTVGPALLDNTSGSAISNAANNPLVLTNSLTFRGSSSLNLGTGNVTLDTNITANVTNNLTVGAISDGGLNFALTKSGPGTLTVVGGGTYTGSTIVNSGTFAITGSGSLTSTNYSIATNATLDLSAVSGLAMPANATLSGSGTFVGPLSDGTSTTILPGGIGVAGTLAINGSLTLNGSGSLNVDLNTANTTGAGVNDLITVSGTLTANGVTPITVNFLSGTPTSTYTIIQYGSFSGTAANFSAPTGFQVTNNTSANAIQLVVTHIPVNLTWRGDGTADVWDINTTSNWIQSGTNQVFNLGDFVTFDDTGSNSPPISVAAPVSPSSTTVSAAQTYDFTGSGIASGKLIKSGSGTLILENNNTYVPPTVINVGTLQVGNNGTNGTLGTGNVTNNATPVLDRSDTVYNISNSISGSGAVTASGSGAVTLSASNSYTGLTTLMNGTLFVQNASSLGTTNSGTVVQSGTLYITANVNITNEALTLAGSGTDGNGALRKGGAGLTVYTGPVSLSANAAIGVDGGATLNLTNASGISGVNDNLALVGGGGTGIIVGPLALGTGGLSVSNGNWTVNQTNNYSGQTTLTGGTLHVAHNRTLGNAPLVFTTNQIELEGGNLDFNTNVTTTLVFNDGLTGFSVDSNSTITVESNLTLTISNQISGAANLTKGGAGTLVLNGSNSLSGTFFVDTGNNANNDGVVLITSSNALVNVPATPGTGTIRQGNNNSGFSVLKLDGTAGPLTFPQEFFVACRNNTNVNIESLAGNNTISGNIDVFQGGSSCYFQCDAGLLTLGGTIQYQGTLANPRTFVFQGAGNELVSGPIIAATTAVAPVSVIKFGSGTVTLAGANTYENATTISNGVLLLTGGIASTGGVTVVSGTLAGIGTISDSVTVQAGGTLTPGLGNQSIGTLTVNGSLTLAGVTSMDINKNTLANDQVAGFPSVTYGGVLAVTNLAGTLAVNDSFTLFNANPVFTSSGNFSLIEGSPGPGLGYSFNPANGVLTVVALPSSPININVAPNGNQFGMAWAPDHLGWILQSQTNRSGISNNWADVPGSELLTNTNIVITLSNPAVFYRLRHP